MTARKTSLSMLDGIRRNDQTQWDRFALLFGPLVYEWCRRAKIPEHDSADIVQEVFKTVAEKIADFRRNQPGDSFHGWMYGITRIKCLDHFRQFAKKATAVGGSSAHQVLQQIPEFDCPELPEAPLESDESSLVRRALELIQTEFETRTWQAFWRVTIDEVKATHVAEELGMSPGAIYNAKYKVLRRLRTEFEGLIPFPDAP
ncbi:MAG: sigma-70 family RNA polymerase sigma factor [Planctomycetaceae bacterium]|nr:sigma-70 family RNA polymerase sigma factor [Planctomycetaceae bacterium]